MDKWKELELEKMKVGGNRRGRDFFESQPDYHEGMSLQEKYNSRAAALYKDKVYKIFQHYLYKNKLNIQWVSYIYKILTTLLVECNHNYIATRIRTFMFNAIVYRLSFVFVCYDSGPSDE